jgi:hypothetical protein
MAHSVLDLPPELLVHTLALLPVQALLRFGQTCRHAHSLANSSLHTLSLGIHTSRLGGIISKLAATQYPDPKATRSAFGLPLRILSSSSSVSSSSDHSRRSSLDSDLFTEDSFDNDPHRVSVFIPNAQSFDYPTLLSFHTALTTSILLRHGSTLRHLDLSLWTLPLPLAKALAALPALRTLSVRIEDFVHVRAIPRRQIAVQRAQEQEAWELLSNTAVWASRINALRIEGGEVSTPQLSKLLRSSRWCHEIWLCKCARIGEDVWGWLAREWEGRAALRVLGVMRCGGQLSERSLEDIGLMRALQVSGPVKTSLYNGHPNTISF